MNVPLALVPSGKKHRDKPVLHENTSDKSSEVFSFLNKFERADSDALQQLPEEFHGVLDLPMEKILERRLLTAANTKLGKEIVGWSIPAITTCPTRTAACEQVCYANKGHYYRKSLQDSLNYRLAVSLREDFADIIQHYLRRTRKARVRIHVSGDFYSLRYLMVWDEIIRTNPGKTFTVYTRAWRDANLRQVLEMIALYENLRLFYSIDRDSGVPSAIPTRVRLAYMQIDSQDIPPVPCDLVFRVERSAVVKYVANTLVCPAENGVTRATCSACQLCYAPLSQRDLRQYRRTRRASRFALPTIN